MIFTLYAVTVFVCLLLCLIIVIIGDIKEIDKKTDFLGFADNDLKENYN